MKRLLSLFVSLCLVLSMLPATAWAAEPGAAHTHCDCLRSLTGVAEDQCASHKADQAWTELNPASLPNSGYYYLAGDLTLSKQWVITGDLHLCTNGFDITSTVAAATTYGILRIQKGAGLTITNCKAQVKDGLLDISDPNKTSTLSGAVTTATSGGMIQVYQGVDLNIWGVEFKNNEVRGSHDSWSGGAILAVGNDGSNTQNVNIAYAAFTENRATAKGGGAIGLIGGVVKVRNTLFKGNIAKHNGAAISVNGTVNLELKDCKFQGNTAENRGGAVSMNSGNPIVSATNCTFTENKTTTAAAQGGGALYVNKGIAILTGCSLTKNENSGYHGSAITQTDGNLTLNGCTVTGNKNTARDNRSAVVIIGGAVSTTVSGKTVISGNSNQNTESNLLLRENGGKQPKLTVGALVAGANITVKTLSAVSAADAIMLSCAGCPVMNSLHGWIRYENRLNSSVDEELLNHSIHYNGAAFSFGPVADHSHAHCACAIEGAVCEGHTASPVAWQKWLSGNSLPKTPGHYYLTKDVVLSGNQNIDKEVYICTNGFDIRQESDTASSQLGLIRSSGAGLTIMNCQAQLKDGKLDTSDPAKTSTLSGGKTTTTSAGMIHVNAGSDLKLIGVALTGNASASNNDKGWGAGAVLCVGDNGADVQNVTIDYCEFADNKATVATAGALSLRGGVATIRNTTFKKNSAATNGGAISLLNTSTKLTVKNCEFAENTAKNGGAIYAITGDVTVSKTLFTGNSATAAGGAVNLSAIGKVEAKISGTDFVKNTSGTEGAALYVSKSTATATNCRIEENTSATGGVVYIREGGKLTLNSCMLTKNQNNGTGGSAITANDGTALTLADTKILNNTNKDKDARAGVVVVDGVAFTVSGNTVIDGNQNGGGESNLLLRAWKGSPKMTVGQLGEDASISITTTALHADPDEFLTKGVSGAWDSAWNEDWITYTNNGMSVSYNDKDLFCFQSFGAHKDHCLCAGGGSGCDHTAVTWTPWGKADSLPTSGNYYLTCDVVLTKGIDLNNTKLNLCLNGHTIRQTGETHIFNIVGDSAELAISDCTAKTVKGVYVAGVITGGANGAILVRPNTLKLYDGILRGNSRQYSGGAINMLGGGTFRMHGGEISGNEAGSHGGAVMVDAGSVMQMTGGSIEGNTSATYGGGIYVRNSSLELTGGVISGNKASEGGGIYGTDSAEITLQGAQIRGNEARIGGGMILFRETHLDYLSGWVSENKTESDGAGIYVANDASMTMTGGTIYNNEGAGGVGIALYKGTVVMNGGTVSTNKAVGNGGGILAKAQSTLTLNGGNIQFNHAKRNGGGVFVTEGSTVTLNGAVIRKNTTGKDGGGAGLFVTQESEMIMRAGSVEENTTAYDGGGMYIVNDSKFTMTGGTVRGNQAQNGAGIGVFKSEAVIKDGLIKGNVAENNAGGLYVQTESKLELKDGSVIGNQAGASGAGVYAFRESQLILTGGDITKNVAISDGGGLVANTKCQVTIAGTDITHNEAKEHSAGGVLLLTESKLNFKSGSVSHNTAKVDGGNVYLYRLCTMEMTGGTIQGGSGQCGGGLRLHSSEAVLQGGTILGNHASVYGGGIHMSDLTKVTLAGISLKNNTTDGSGGALYVSGTGNAVTLDGSEIRGNKAVNFGGGLAVFNYTDFVMNSGKICENATSDRGGGLYFNRGNVVIKDGEISGNTAPMGGGIYGHGDVMAKEGTFLMTGGTVSKNQADIGGGVSIYRLRATFEGGKIENNTAKQGGGIHTTNTSTVYVGAMEIANNTAEDGGGLYLTRGTFTDLVGTKITGNAAKQSGGGVWADGRLDMKDITVTQNQANKGGGIYLEKAGYDGESYVSSVYKIGGKMLVTDNKDTDLYISEGTLVNTDAKGVLDGTKIGVTLETGTLTRTVIGAYDYEGGDLQYVITAGNRSITDPEPVPETNTAADITDLVWIPVAVVAAAVPAAIVLLLLKKKKAKQ